VNAQPATVAVLRQLAPDLAAIHSQRESIVAFDAQTRLVLLDTYSCGDGRPRRVESCGDGRPRPSSGSAAPEAHQSVRTTHAAWMNLRTQLADLERDEQDRLRLADLWSFQKKE